MQQQQLSPTTMTERMALTAALMQFMASANSVPNGGNPLEGGGGGGTANGHMSAAGAGMQSAAAAAFLPLFSSGKLYGNYINQLNKQEADRMPWFLRQNL
jgi:hypothetical protein